jgi:DNA-binding transcriptional ArsR family regulator
MPETTAGRRAATLRALARLVGPNKSYVTCTALADELDRPAASVANDLAALRTAGLVETWRNGQSANKNRWRPSETAAGLMQDGRDREAVADGGHEFDTAELREGEPDEDLDAHARRNAEQLAMLTDAEREELDIAASDLADEQQEGGDE